MGQLVHFRGGPSGLPQEVIDDLPRQLIIEYPATISLAYDTHTGQVTQARIEAMPDRAHLFDRETWHELPEDDESVRTLIATFDPEEPLQRIEHMPVRWLHPDQDYQPS